MWGLLPEPHRARLFHQLGTRAPTAVNVSSRGTAGAVMALGAAADLDQTTGDTEEGHYKNERAKDLLQPKVLPSSLISFLSGPSSIK